MPKDACYHKVKSRYKVFPSAYASGAIAKCRKVGAANYGNKTKKAKDGTYNNMQEIRESRNVAKRKSKNKKIARGCGIVLEGRRKATKYS
jgi:hypothetical protein